MKKITFSTLLCCGSLLFSLSLLAQVSFEKKDDAIKPPVDKPNVSFSANQEYFSEEKNDRASENLTTNLSLLKLPVKKRERYEELKKKTWKAYLGKKNEEALAMLQEMKSILPEDSKIHNMEGSIFLRLKKYDQAREAFEKAVALRPDFFEAQFNLVELFFKRKKYEEAYEKFQTLLKTKASARNYDYIFFKLFLIDLILDRPQQARKMAERFTGFEKSPVFYFVKASLCFYEGKKQEAYDWVKSARKIYPPVRNLFYIESLQSFGWLSEMADGKKSSEK